MSSKIWNDAVGVARGFWSVAQKAQTMTTRVQKAPRQPSIERLNNYSQRYGMLIYYSFDINTSKLKIEQKKYDFRESELPESEANSKFQNIEAERKINESIKDHNTESVVPEVKQNLEEVKHYPGSKPTDDQSTAQNASEDSAETPFNPATTPSTPKSSKKLNQSKKEAGIPKSETKNTENLAQTQKEEIKKSKTEREIQEAEQEIMEEIEQREKKLDYQETPFYMKQDRPVFSGKETRIPTSPSARAFHFGALGVSIVGGTISEAFKQTLGMSKPLPETQGGSSLKRYAMTNSNSDRLSNTLCKMRGAALKIGQILSNTEESFIPKSIQQAFEKARQRADIMPQYQVNEMLEREIGKDWREKFLEFSMYPLAAASIGQVHEARLKDGTKVAVKIQYPNIAQSIDSDFKNFKRLLKVLGAVPENFYIDELLANVNAELHEECDYTEEAKKQNIYKLLSQKDEYINDYYVPKVYESLSTKHILTQEFIFGDPVDEFSNHSQEVRDRVGGLMLKLCIHEIFLLKFMQTDPNPANFYYDPKKKMLNLIDMGAAHQYADNFVDDYFQIVYGATYNHEDRIIEYSKRLGFLTGEENKEMLAAHSKSAMFIGEPFKHEGPFFDFGNSDISRKLMDEIPVMLKNRLSPPPQEVYSLHRKLSGAYFICIKLRSRVNSRDMFKEVSDRFIKAKSLDMNAKII